MNSTPFRLLLIAFAIISFANNVSHAQQTQQRGSLIEDLFRTITEAQLQRQRGQQDQIIRRRPQPPPTQRPPAQRTPAPLPRSPQLPRNPQSSINVGTPEMARFADALSGFSRELGFLISDLQNASRQTASFRRVMPQAYQVAANADSLLRGCDGLRDFTPLTDRYASLDAQWRQLSFELRALPDLTREMSSHVRDCDRYISTMSRQVGVTPQLDRHGLHDKMIVAATYMQAMLDDLQLCGLDRHELRSFTHDGRLLRQALLAEADRAEVVTYEQLSSSFTDFVARWKIYSDSLYALGDPHLNSRLDRIAQCGEETYAMLWMRPPVNSRDLTESTSRLKRAHTQLMDQLTLRAIGGLDPDTRSRINDGSRRMQRLIRELDEDFRHGGRGDSSNRFREIDSIWSSLRGLYVTLPRVSPATIASVDRECETIRRALRIAPSGDRGLAYEDLIDAAASLEGSAEYFQADITRYQRYFQPAAFGRAIQGSSDAFYESSKRLHANLHDRADLRELQASTETMIDAWQRLSRDVANLRTGGITGRRAENLENAASNLAPEVAKIAAALLP